MLRLTRSLLARAAAADAAGLSTHPPVQACAAWTAVWGAVAQPALWSTSQRAFSTDGTKHPVPHTTDPQKLRSFCIIAHIDHGKTTLADRLLSFALSQQGSSSKGAGEGMASLDSGALERERGITILSKVTSFSYKGHVLNMLDTPGHADFGGEVERVLGMVDGAVLLVDANEGPLAQTRFVLGKALARGLAPLVVLNKVDRPDATSERCGAVESSLFDLMVTLGATDQQLEFPVLYASGRQGWASLSHPSTSPLGPDASMAPLLDMILKHVPPPSAPLDAPFALGVAMTERDNYLGRIVTGRVASGTARVGDVIKVIPGSVQGGSSSSTGGPEASPSGEAEAQTFKISRITKRAGMEVVPVESAIAGDVVSIAGAPASIADTIAAPSVTTPLDLGHIDPPTLSMVFAANDSPFSGRAGKAVTGRVIGERLMAEAETSVSLRVTPVTGSTEKYEVQARGELQLAVLIEELRREGMELSVSPPQVLLRQEGGQVMEPVEEVVCEVAEELAGQIIEQVSLRRGELTDMVPVKGGMQRLSFHVPSRGMIGFKPLFVHITRGEGLLTRAFLHYEPHRGPLGNLRKGVMVSQDTGKATKFALTELVQRGTFFIKPGEEVYGGQIVGEHCRDEDLDINPTRQKHLTNIRSAHAEVKVQLPAPRAVALEDAIGFITAEELIEVTPSAVRMRKVELDADRRRVLARQAKSAAAKAAAAKAA